MAIRTSTADRAYYGLNTVLVVITAAVVLYPLLYIIGASFSSARAVISGRVWLWPVEITLDGYRAVFGYRNIWIGYGNTVFYASVGTVINVVVTIAAAYPLSRKDLWGRNFLMFLFTFTMIFSGGLIPTFILVRQLGLIDTRWAMLLPNALAVWNLIITRTYYQVSLPDELLEAARMDGCSDIRFILRMVLPLSGAITAVNVLFYAVGHWNGFFDALIYLNKKRLQPLQLVLRDVLIANEVDSENTFIGDIRDLEYRQNLRTLLKFAIIIVGSAPVLMLYPFVQRYFVRGVMIGSIKG